MVTKKRKYRRQAPKQEYCVICHRKLRWPQGYMCLGCLVELTQGVPDPYETLPEKDDLEEEDDDEIY